MMQTARSEQPFLLQIRQFSFTYPDASAQALSEVDLTLREGDFCILTGRSGSGKSTLLRNLVPALRPNGSRCGDIRFDGAPEDIAFVQQNPHHQIVMDEVWHELAFGLENMGYDAAAVERRIAEIAHFFGIVSWIRRQTRSLSGGEKQILNLAAALIRRPRMLLLDEPTAQLDPMAVQRFFQMLQRVHREIGTTIIMSEHRLNDVVSLATHVLHLDAGRPAFFGAPPDFIQMLLNAEPSEQLAVPEVIRGAWQLNRAACAARRPMTTLDVRRLIREAGAAAPATADEPGRSADPSHPAGQCRPASQSRSGSTENRPSDGAALQARALCFRYEKTRPLVLDEASLALRHGEIHALIGGNGSGKSTMLYLLAGVLRPEYGRIERRPGLNIGLLTQDPQSILTGDTVQADLMEHAGWGGYDLSDVRQLADELGMGALLAAHPYDISGGEMQKAALAKLLLLKPDVLLMDEPTKGLDAVNKEMLRAIFLKLRRQGRTLLLVTHDLEFAAGVADRCSLLFDGRVVVTEPSGPFFSGNAFYTTEINRAFGDWLPGAVTLSDLTPDRPDGMGV